MEVLKKRGFFAKITLLIAISGMSLLFSCDKNEPVRVEVCPGLKLKSVYIYNEGQFGKSMGSINILTPGATSIETTNTAFGNTTSHGSQWMGRLYFVSKQGKRFVGIDEKTFTEIGYIEDMKDGRAFAGIDATRGVITTAAGAYIVDLEKFKIGQMLEGTDKAQCGGVFVMNDNIFLIHRNEGIFVYDIKADYKLIKKLGKASVGFTLMKGGSLWAANTTELIRINTKTLTAERITLPTGVLIPDTWGAWNQGSLLAVPNEYSLYFTNKKSTFGGSNSIYKYRLGDASSLEQPFATSTVDGQSFYGSGIGIDPISGNIIGTLVQDGWGDNYKYNSVVEFDAKTGKEIRRIDYEGFYFPSGMIFITE